MKKFNLELAIDGHPLETVSGNKVISFFHSELIGVTTLLSLYLTTAPSTYI